MQSENIPAIAIAGMFFFSAYAPAAELEFAVDLFEKSEWALCSRECKRELLAGSEPVERFQLLEAMSEVRSGAAPDRAITLLHPIIRRNRDRQVSAIASYEIARQYWRIDRFPEALEAFTTSFHTTTNKQLFLRAACSMSLLFKDAPGLKAGRSDLLSQINTSRAIWTGILFSECAKPGQEVTSEAPNWIVRFYRAQISPAIGRRCNLDPSCSEYFQQAGQRHGLNALPMIADRFFREPGVNHARTDPVLVNGQIRYRDHLDDHDFWMK